VPEPLVSHQHVRLDFDSNRVSGLNKYFCCASSLKILAHSYLEIAKACGTTSVPWP